MRLFLFFFCSIGTFLLRIKYIASDNLIPVHRKSETWNTLINNGGFEADKILVVGNRGSLLNVVPSGWRMAHGVSLIAYKSFPKFLQDHAGEIYLAMQSTSGFLSQEIKVQGGSKVKLSFSVLSYCLTAECVQNGISVYTSSSIPVQPETSQLIYQYLSNDMNVWLKKSIAFVAPSDKFNISFNAFSDGPRSSGILLDNIELVSVEEESPYVPIEGKSAEPSSTSTFAPTSDSIPVVGSLADGETSSVKFNTKPAPKGKPGAGPPPPGNSIIPPPPKGLDQKPKNPFSTKHEVSPPTTSVDQQEDVETDGYDDDYASADKQQQQYEQSTLIQSSEEDSTSMASGGISSTETTSSAAASRFVKKKSATAPTGCPLRIELLDSWGDGWHGAYLSISNAIGVYGSNDYGISNNGMVSIEPHANLHGRSSWQGTVFVRGDNSGETVMMIADVNKRVPRESWEIFWVVTLPDYSLFVGDYESVVVLTCNADADGANYVATIERMQKPVEDGIW